MENLWPAGNAACMVTTSKRLKAVDSPACLPESMTEPVEPGGKYALILFDLDGTLADTHQLIFDSFNYVLRKYRSVEFTPEQILTYFGPTEEVCIENMLHPENFEAVWNDFLGYYSSHLNESRIFKGIVGLLKELKSSGRLVGVLTAKGVRTADLTLEYHGVRDLFDIVVTGSSVRKHKPDPEGILIALRELNVSSSKTVVVGDSLSDYRASVAAGSTFIAVTYGSVSKNRFDGVDCTKAASVDDLTSLLLSAGRDRG